MRQEQQLLRDEIYDQVEQYGSFVIMRYEGLKAEVATNFRNRIFDMGGNVEMVRKRILLKAAEKAGVSLQLSELPGHIGLVFAGEDPIETMKAVFAFSKENPNVLEVLGGRFEGQLYNAQQTEHLSQLPGKDQMRSELLSVLQAPLSETLSVCEAILTAVMHCIENKIRKDQES